MFLEGRAVVLFELRIKTGFDRVESQQQGREAVDRPNVTPLDLPERFVSAAVDLPVPAPAVTTTFRSNVVAARSRSVASGRRGSARLIAISLFGNIFVDCLLIRLGQYIVGGAPRRRKMVFPADVRNLAITTGI